MKNDALISTTKCFHCGDDCSKDLVIAHEHSFCCNGCKSVYEILHQHELDNYYCLNEMPGNSPKFISQNKFVFLDEQSIADKLINFKSPSLNKVVFYLPQIHSSSCLWLLENLSKMHDGIITAQVNFVKKEIAVAYNEQKISLRKVAETLASIGYEPHISLNDLTGENKKDNSKSKSAIYKLGVAGFCFMNIMLISFPEYVGLSKANDATLTTFFRFINLMLALPVFFYCAQEFFVNAFYSYKQRYLNIDAPIALAILVTFARSVYEIVSENGPGFLDSMSGIVFFMLLGRMVQNRLHTTLQFNRDYKSYFPIAVTSIKNELQIIKPVNEIVEQDVILLQHQEIIPVDSLMSKGDALIDYSYITGESEPVAVNKGELVYAGGKIAGGNVEVIAVKVFAQNNFTQLWNNSAFSKQETEEKTMVTTISKYFSVIVILIATITFLFHFRISSSTALNAATAVLIIACPCALLLTASFTYGYIIDLFAKIGCFVKNAATVDRMSKIDTIVFDKTGTLTDTGNLEVKPHIRNWTNEQRNIALSLMAHSMHPLSKAILNSEGKYEKITLQHFKEITGSGLEAWQNDSLIKIGNASFTKSKSISNSGSEVFITVDGNQIAYFTVAYALREGAEKMFDDLKSYDTALLSGDGQHSRKMMEELFPQNAQLIFQQNPQEKLDYILHLQEQGKKVMMIGDGLNDAGALKQSDVGVAIVSDSFSFSPACDVLLEAKQLSYIGKIIRLAKQSRKIIVLGFIYSLLYNIIGLYFATQGLLAPVIAAILMPLSSLGIILFTYLGSKYIFSKAKINYDINHSEN